MGFKEALIGHLRKIVSFLNENGYEYALAGGLAFSALVEPRATVDIDILISIDESMMEDLIRKVKKKYSNIIVHESPMEFTGIKVWRMAAMNRDKEMIIDLLLVGSEFQKSAIRRSSEITFIDIKLKVISLEDLIILKILSARTQDKADLERVFKTMKNEIDCEYLNYWKDRLKLQYPFIS